MPRTTAPLLSFGASGQIAKTQVYASWKGVPYVRRYVIPANPQTTKQTNNRDIWRMLGNAWLYMPSPVQAAFDTYAIGKPLTGRNKFFQDNQRVLAVSPPKEDLDGFIFSPGSRGGLPPTNLAITPGNDQLTFTADLPAVPTGWTLTASIAAAIPNQAPQDPFSGLWYVNRDTSTPDNNVITSIPGEIEYACGFFLEWTRPDGLTAYSISLFATGEPT